MKTFLCLLALCLPVAADVIELSNGDRVTGAIVNSDGDTVTVTTELMGDVKIKRSGIAAVRSDEPLVVTLESGAVVTGAIATEQGTVRVRPETGTEVSAPVADVRAIRTSATQAAWEREQERLTNPGWLDFWAGAADLGVAAARGNSRTTTVSTGLDLTRTTGFDKTRLNFSQIYAKQSTTEPFGVIANRTAGAARYERNLSDRLFAFTLADFLVDEFQDLDLRSVLGGGLGWKIVKTPRTALDFSAGANWSRENFADGIVRNSGELNLGEDFTHKLTGTMRVFQSLSLYPNLSDTGEFRLDLDAGMSAKINSYLSWNFTVTNLYISNPIGDKRNNDMLLTTGISFTFAQQ